jgi:plasmid stabilization system protein ParE
MTTALLVHPAARSWYDDISSDLGNDSAQAVAEAIDLILHNPRLYADIGVGIHRAFVKRFPYQVFYRFATDQIRVLAVHHSHADRQAVLEQARRRTDDDAGQEPEHAVPAERWPFRKGDLLLNMVWVDRHVRRIP